MQISKLRKFIYTFKFSYRPEHVALLSSAKYNKFFSLEVNIYYHQLL
jgi:hypothetical protein